MTKWQLNCRIKELEEKCRREYERGYNDGVREALANAEKIYKLRIDNLVKEFKKEKLGYEASISNLRSMISLDDEPPQWFLQDY